MAELNKKEFIELITGTVKTVLDEYGIGKTEAKHAEFPNAKEQAEKEGVDYKSLSQPERVRLFFKAVINNDSTVVKALGGDVPSAGGYLIPTDFRKEIVNELNQYGIMRKLVKVVPVSLRSGSLPKIEGGVSYSWSTSYDNKPLTESAMTFGELAYSLKRLGVFVPVAEELIEDNAFDLTKILKEEFARAFAEAEDIAMLKGDGSTVPVTGLSVDTSINTVTASAALDYDTVVDAFYALPSKYRGKSVILTNTDGIKALKKVKDSNGNPILVSVNETKFTVFGRPVIETDMIDTTSVDPDGVASSGDEYNATKIVIGDTKMAYLFDRGEFGIKASDQAGDAFINNQVIFKAWNRVDFKVASYNAFVRLENVIV